MIWSQYFQQKKIKIGQNRTVLDPIMQKFEMAFKNLFKLSKTNYR